MVDGDVEFPVGSPVVELVLDVPVDPALFGVEFDEAVAAQALVGGGL